MAAKKQTKKTKKRKAAKTKRKHQYPKLGRNLAKFVRDQVSKHGAKAATEKLGFGHTLLHKIIKAGGATTMRQATIDHINRLAADNGNATRAATQPKRKKAAKRKSPTPSDYSTQYKPDGTYTVLVENSGGGRITATHLTLANVIMVMKAVAAG